jgi:tetratricopeptide (TPR) repeat protein
MAFEEVRMNGFVYDDAMYITGNPHVQSGITSESVRWALTTFHSGSWHPLTWLSHLTDCSIFGLDAAGHHLVNLLLHMLNTVLLFYVLARITGSVWPSVFVAAAFALHPLRVESVAWVAERKDVMSGTFFMLTLLAYARYVERRELPKYILVVVGFVLGLLAKPMLVTLPFVLLLFDVWPLKRLERGAAPRRPPADAPTRVSASRLLLEKIPLFAIAAVFSVITFVAQRSQGAMSMTQSGDFSFAVRAQNALLSYVTYIGRTLYPTGLAVFYPHPAESIPAWQAVAAALALAAISGLAIYLARRGHAYALVGWLWYLGTLLPVIGLVQVGGQAMADRYTYLPSIGLGIIVAWGTARLLARQPGMRHVVAVVAAVVVVALIAATRTQVRYWRDSSSLYGRALAVTKDNWLAHYNLGRAEMLEGKIDPSVAHFRETVRLVPENADARNNLGVALTAKGRYDEAIEQLREALRIDPSSARAHNNLGQAFAFAERSDEAVVEFEEAVRLDPAFAKAHYNLCYVFSAQGKMAEALEHCDEALRLNPDYPQAAQLRTLLRSRNRP